MAARRATGVVGSGKALETPSKMNPIFDTFRITVSFCLDSIITTIILIFIPDRVTTLPFFICMFAMSDVLPFLHHIHFEWFLIKKKTDKNEKKYDHLPTFQDSSVRRDVTISRQNFCSISVFYYYLSHSAG